MESYSRSVQIVRERSYKTLVDSVRAVATGGRWLDVGCSFGWLLQYVQARGYEPYGVEPSAGAAEMAREKGLSVEIGAYPDQNGGHAPYQVISFIDVLEHLPDPFLALEAARHHLSTDGVLVVQVPDRECLMYTIALSMYKASGGRASSPLRRLYLDGLDFPHIFYHSSRSLRTLLERSGLQVLQQYHAPTGSWDTMVDRVAYLEEPGRTASVTRMLAFGAGVLQLLDNLLGHGGLLVMVGRSRTD
jgi:SAM-dependent methyltransferase